MPTNPTPTAAPAEVCEGCGKRLFDSYITVNDGTKWHRSCRDETLGRILVDRDHRSDAAADAYEAEIERRMP